MITSFQVAPLLQVADPQLPPVSFFPWLIFALIKLLIVFTLYMVAAALLTLAERKLSAWIQDRHGPNRVGPWGLMQPLADGLKNLVKEEAAPSFASGALYNLAPIISFIPALITWAVIPFGAPMPTRWGRVDMVLADLPIGYLYVLAIGSLGVYGIVLAGWASNNKYALLGGLRSSAQMISYEIAMGMSTIPVVLLAGNVTLSAIVMRQSEMGWNAVTLTFAFFVFVIAAFAETNRLPFDLPEAESELITGYHTEYSSMKFSFFFIAEYANMVTASAMMATLFLGGWDIPFWHGDNVGQYSILVSLLTILSFLVKVLFFLFFFMWIRWTLPRFRYDQLMSLGWKILLPMTLAYIMVVAGAVLGLDMARVPRDWHFALSMFALNVVIMVLVFWVLDRGRIVSPASSRIRTAELERLRTLSRRSPLTPREAGD
ncbi:MAG TPA: NADH-quinone oxidoreductase subunit NuoH [Gemmatimonadaceae bacterium]|nr:NADH-quinone oxidoreductase subunit NuoH [Gemmatimonadaceae bacterium]